jgi:hypothetical protein
MDSDGISDEIKDSRVKSKTPDPVVSVVVSVPVVSVTDFGC